MLIKMYWTVWAVVAFAAAMFFVTGNFTALVGVVFGFILFGVVFMGMIGVLPAMVSHPAVRKPPAPPLPAARADALKPSTTFAGGVLKSA